MFVIDAVLELREGKFPINFQTILNEKQED